MLGCTGAGALSFTCWELGRKGRKATAVILCGLLFVTGLPLVSLSALNLWLSSVCKKSYQAETVVHTDSGALHTPKSFTSDTVISQFPFEDWPFLALLHAGPSRLSFID